MDMLTEAKFTEVTDHIIIKCQRRRIHPEDFLIFYNYFIFLKSSNYNLIDAVLLAKALLGASIESIDQEREYAINNAKKYMENYIIEMTGQDYTINR